MKMRRIKIPLMVLGCLMVQSRARASEMERLRVMEAAGPAVQAEAFTNGGLSGQAAVPGAAAENRLAPMKASRPGVVKSRPRGAPGEDHVSKGASRDAKPAGSDKGEKPTTGDKAAAAGLLVVAAYLAVMAVVLPDPITPLVGMALAVFLAIALLRGWDHIKS